MIGLPLGIVSPLFGIFIGTLDLWRILEQTQSQIGDQHPPSEKTSSCVDHKMGPSLGHYYWDSRPAANSERELVTDSLPLEPEARAPENDCPFCFNFSCLLCLICNNST